jgi:hypothetical protein
MKSQVDSFVPSVHRLQRLSSRPTSYQVYSHRTYEARLRQPRLATPYRHIPVNENDALAASPRPPSARKLCMIDDA